MLRTLAVPLMVVAGAGLAVQSQVNGALAGRLGGGATGGLTAAVVSFGGGLAVVVLVALARGAVRRQLLAVWAAVRDGELRWWHLVGGAAGALLVASQGVAVGVVGVALFTVGVVAGQTVSSLVVDRAGVAPGGLRPVTRWRVVGAALAVLGVSASAAERLAGPGAGSSAGVLLVLLPVLAGAGIAWQQAVNGRVSAVGGPWAATLVNFTVGTATLLLAWGTTLVLGDLPLPPPDEAWLYVGGLIGVTFIAAAAVLVRLHGVLVLALCAIGGNVTGAVLLDAVGGDSQLGLQGLAAAALTLLGAGLAVVGGSRRR